MKKIFIDTKQVSDDGAAIRVRTFKLSPEGQQMLTTHAPQIVSTRAVHTIPTNDGWAVVRSNTCQPVTVYHTKEEAQKAAVELAKQEGVEHVIHSKDGAIVSDSKLPR